MCCHWQANHHGFLDNEVQSDRWWRGPEANQDGDRLPLGATEETEMEYGIGEGVRAGD